MGKKKNGKSQKYSKVSNGDAGNKKGKNKKASAANGDQQASGFTPRRSKRARRPTEKESLNDYTFRQEVEDGNRTIINIEADGNCLFGSVSDQLYHDFGNMHAEVRHEVCDFLDFMKEEFQHFLLLEDDDEDVADFDSYVQSMRENGEWGGNVELVAASRLYRRNIVVFSTEHAFTIEHGQEESGGPDMILSYHGSEHYNSVRDNNAGMPPPPTKMSLEKLAVRESMESKTEATLGTENMDEGDGDEQEKEEALPQRPPKSKAPCPCGSGLRYKKCCIYSDRRKARASKWKANNASSISNDISMEDTNDNESNGERHMEGGFRVLKI